MFETIFSLVFELFRGKELGRIPGLGTGLVKMFLYLVLKLCNGKLYVKLDDLKFCYMVTPQRVLLEYRYNYESNVSSLFRSMVKEGWTVVDLGASLGYYTLLASRLVGETGLVLSFEPVPLRFRGLMENIEINELRNVRPFQLAISDSFSERKMDSSGGGFGDKSKYMVTVKTVPLDSFLDTNEIDLIKMDIEGAELEALRGMENILAKGKSKIICECHPSKFLSLGYKTEDIVNILKRYGYNIYLISERGLIFKNTLSNELAHYLFSKESHHEKRLDLH